MEPLTGDAERGIREHLAAARALTVQIGEITGSGADSAGLIHVVVAPSGKVLELTLDPRVMRMPSQTLAEEIKAALETARSDAERQVNDAMVDAFRTNPSWQDILSGEAPVDMAAALPALPDPETFDEMIRAARRDAGG